MGKYRTIIFDMGNVLISFSHEKMLKQISAISQMPLEIIQSLFIEKGLGLQYEKGEISSFQLYKILSQAAFKSFDFKQFLEAGCGIFTPRPEMVQIVKDLKSQGLRLLLLSNTNEAHFDYILNHYDFLPFFDQWLLSFKLHKVKPEKDIYEVALLHSHALPEECFYIDDIPEYVAAASQLGIQGHVYQTYPLLLKALKQQKILS